MELLTTVGHVANNPTQRQADNGILTAGGHADNMPLTARDDDDNDDLAYRFQKCNIFIFCFIYGFDLFV